MKNIKISLNLNFNTSYCLHVRRFIFESHHEWSVYEKLMKKGGVKETAPANSAVYTDG